MRHISGGGSGAHKQKVGERNGINSKTNRIESIFPIENKGGNHNGC